MTKCLIVGINDYGGENDLQGCVNDVRDVANTLSVINVTPPSQKSVRIRTDARATRKNILADLKWLTKDTKPGETLVFWYSGHGSYQIDPHGNEEDGRDECLVHHDYDTAGMITDDDLQEVIQWIPEGKVNLKIFLDSGFSGTATRSVSPVNGPTTQKVRFLLPPIDSAFFGDGPHVEVRNPIFSRQTVVVPQINHVLWAGCRDNQTSAEGEIEGTPRGVFSYTMCKILRKSSGLITRKKLSIQVARDIKQMGYEQVPVLEVNAGRVNEQVFK